MDHEEFSRMGGKSRSEKKLKAIRANLEKARDARSRKAKSRIDDGRVRSSEAGKSDEGQEKI